MQFFIIFIAGMLFYSFVFPLLDCVVEVAVAKKTVYTSNLSVIVNKNQIEIQKSQNEIEDSNVSAIGFSINSTEDPYFDDDFGEENYSKVGKIGF